MTGVHVNRSLTIPDDEIELSFSTSGGPGGQHANKTATRVEIAWNLEASRALDEGARAQIRRKLGHRIDSTGRLRVVSDDHRSQLKNRQEAMARLAKLVREALRPERRRLPTAPTRTATERRLETKRLRAETKALRRTPAPDD